MKTAKNDLLSPNKAKASADSKAESSNSKDKTQTTAVTQEGHLPFGLLTKVYEQVSNTEGKNSKNIQKNYLSNMFK